VLYASAFPTVASAVLSGDLVGSRGWAAVCCAIVWVNIDRRMKTGDLWIQCTWIQTASVVLRHDPKHRRRALAI
jgi:hypothetical protein